MKLLFGDLVVDATPAAAADFTPWHHEQLDGARFQWRPDRQGWADHLLTGFLSRLVRVRLRPIDVR